MRRLQKERQDATWSVQANLEERKIYSKVLQGGQHHVGCNGYDGIGS